MSEISKVKPVKVRHYIQVPLWVRNALAGIIAPLLMAFALFLGQMQWNITAMRSTIAERYVWGLKLVEAFDQRLIRLEDAAFEHAKEDKNK